MRQTVCSAVCIRDKVCRLPQSIQLFHDVSEGFSDDLSYIASLISRIVRCPNSCRLISCFLSISHDFRFEYCRWILNPVWPRTDLLLSQMSTQKLTRVSVSDMYNFLHASWLAATVMMALCGREKEDDGSVWLSDGCGQKRTGAARCSYSLLLRHLHPSGLSMQLLKLSAKWSCCLIWYAAWALALQCGSHHLKNWSRSQTRDQMCLIIPPDWLPAFSPSPAQHAGERGFWNTGPGFYGAFCHHFSTICLFTPSFFFIGVSACASGV